MWCVHDNIYHRMMWHAAKAARTQCHIIRWHTWQSWADDTGYRPIDSIRSFDSIRQHSTLRQHSIIDSIRPIDSIRQHSINRQLLTAFDRLTTTDHSTAFNHSQAFHSTRDRNFRHCLLPVAATLSLTTAFGWNVRHRAYNSVFQNRTAVLAFVADQNKASWMTYSRYMKFYNASIVDNARIALGAIFDASADCRFRWRPPTARYQCWQGGRHCSTSCDIKLSWIGWWSIWNFVNYVSIHVGDLNFRHCLLL